MKPIMCCKNGLKYTKIYIFQEDLSKLWSIIRARASARNIDVTLKTRYKDPFFTNRQQKQLILKS